MRAPPYSADEIMTLTAARQLRNGAVCFVGIGLPSAACNLARLTHAPDLILIYESGTVGTRPVVLPLSIGDGELAESATCIVPLPEVFAHYLQRGRVDVGFLGAAQIDRFGNLNSTVIGSYAHPVVRLPGAGGAPDIANCAREVLVIMKQTPRSFVSALDFRTSCGYLEGSGARAASGCPGTGPRAVITDFGVLRPHPDTFELELAALYPGVSVEAARAATGWPLRVAATLELLTTPDQKELTVLRNLHARTRQAHGRAINIKLSAAAGQRQGTSLMQPSDLHMTLPGPRAQALIARDGVVSTPSYVRDYPFVMARGSGAEVWDVDGNRYLDFMSGIGVCSTGHAHPQVVQAIKEAADDFLHISSDYWHERMTRLAERVSGLDPLGEAAQVLICQSGTEAVEGALKLARYVTGRPRFLAFLGGFHGRSMGSLAFTSSKYTQQQGFFPTMPGVTHVPYPNPYRPLLVGADQGNAVIDYIENILFTSNVPPTEVAGILVEPIQGEGGYIVPPDGFLAGLRALCDRHGILLIFDEVQSGIGRTGKMFASQHWGVQPDIMVLAKGVASGLPLGLVVARRRYMQQWRRGAHGNTFGGNPLCCAAALATLDLVEGEYAANAAAVGEYFMGRLRKLQQRFPCIGDVRGKGLMIGMELVIDRTTRAPARALCDAVLTRAYHNGLLLLSCGWSTVRFIPPLMISRRHVDEAVMLFETALTEAVAQ